MRQRDWSNSPVGFPYAFPFFLGKEFVTTKSCQKTAFAPMLILRWVGLEQDALYGPMGWLCAT